MGRLLLQPVCDIAMSEQQQQQKKRKRPAEAADASGEQPAEAVIRREQGRERRQQSPPSPVRRYQGMTESDFYTPLYNKQVFLALIDGNVYEGLLEGVDKFHLLVRTQNGLMLFSKHAITYVMGGREQHSEAEQQ